MLASSQPDHHPLALHTHQLHLRPARRERRCGKRRWAQLDKRNRSLPLNAPTRTAHAWAIPFSYDEAVVKLIADRCTELESGGRMIDSILTNTLLPRISHELLSRMMRGKSVTRVATTAAGGEFKYAFD